MIVGPSPSEHADGAMLMGPLKKVRAMLMGFCKKVPCRWGHAAGALLMWLCKRVPQYVDLVPCRCDHGV
jgi:hypothetical protein